MRNLGAMITMVAQATEKKSPPCVRNANTLGVPLRRIRFKTISTN
jgi:hypothetical protein